MFQGVNSAELKIEIGEDSYKRGGQLQEESCCQEYLRKNSDV